MVVKRKKLSKTPDATAVAKIERRQPRAPEITQRYVISHRIGSFDVEEPAATGADVKPIVEIVFGVTAGRDAALEKLIAHSERL